jgi:hypothetical protein
MISNIVKGVEYKLKDGPKVVQSVFEFDCH